MSKNKNFKLSNSVSSQVYELEAMRGPSIGYYASQSERLQAAYDKVYPETIAERGTGMLKFNLMKSSPIC